MPLMMDPCLNAEAYPIIIRRAHMILFLALLRFTVRRRSAVVAGAAREFTRRRRSRWQYRSKHLEGHRLKRWPARVDSSSEPGYRLASRGRQKHEDDRLGLLERIFDPLSRRRREMVRPGWRCLEVG